MSRNPISQLASLGEEVLGKAAHNPTAARVLGGVMQLKDRVDDLSKRVRGLEAMEQRIDALERRLDELDGTPKKSKAPAKRAASGDA